MNISICCLRLSVVFCFPGNEEIANFLLQKGAGFSSYTLMDHPAFCKNLLRQKVEETSSTEEEQVRGGSRCRWHSFRHAGRNSTGSHWKPDWYWRHGVKHKNNFELSVGCFECPRVCRLSVCFGEAYSCPGWNWTGSWTCRHVSHTWICRPTAWLLSPLWCPGVSSTCSR